MLQNIYLSEGLTVPNITYRTLSGSALAAVAITAAQAAPILPVSYTYLTPPQSAGHSSYPDSGNELTDGVIPTRSWGTQTIRTFAQAANWSGWRLADPKIRFDFDRAVNIGSLALTADDADGRAGVHFPEGVTIEAGGKTISRNIDNPDGSGPARELFNGLNLFSDSVTLTVDGGSRNWTMLGEVEFDTRDFAFDGFQSTVQSNISGRIDSPFGTSVALLTDQRVNLNSLFTDPLDNTTYEVNQSGRLLQPTPSSDILTEFSIGTADASVAATTLVLTDVDDSGDAIDQLASAFGRNRVQLATSDGLFGTLKSYADATVGWSDYFIIDGGVGDAELTLKFDVEGAISGDNAGIDFTVQSTQPGTSPLTTTSSFVASAQTHGQRGYFNDPFNVTIPFTYNEIFQLSAVLDAYASGNSAVEFLNTVELTQFVIPDGAALRSSANEDGLVELSAFNVINQSAAAVPSPASWLLLLTGMLVIRRR